MTLTGGELIGRVLDAHSVKSVFAVAGASHTHLLDPLDRMGVTIVSSRHESGAVGAADGYARVSGKPGFALIVADQGLPNAIGALAVAWHALSPVVVLVAAPPPSLTEADRSIDQDQLGLVTPITKWARTVPSVQRLADYFQTAIKHATEGRPGPVVLLVPEPFFRATAQPPAVCHLPMAARPEPDDGAILRAAKLLSGAQRPIIIAGGGSAWSDSGSALQELSQGFSIPVLANSLGRGQVAEDGHLSFSWPYAQIAASHADVVLLVGARLTQRLGLGLSPRFSASARFIQIDIDAESFHRNRASFIAIQADASKSIVALTKALGRVRDHPFDSQWLRDALEPRRQRIAEILATHSGRIHPLQLGEVLMQKMPDNTQLVGDGADIQSWMYGVLRVRRKRGFLDHYPMGAMGSCTALAVGAAAAHTESEGKAAPPTVLVTGDGALGFHPAEIHAAVRGGLWLIVIVGNDGAWGTERHGQIQAIGRSVNTELGVLPYEKLGQAFGAQGVRVTSLDELKAAMDNALESARVVVINVEIDPDAGAELKTNPAVQMIQFSDILDGQTDLAELPDN